MNKSPTISSWRYHIMHLNLWQESGYLTLILLESLWMGLAYYLLAFPISSYWLVIVVAGFGVLFSYFLSRYLNYRKLKSNAHKAIYLGWLVFYLLLCQWSLNSLHTRIDPTPWMLLLGAGSFEDIHLIHFFRLLIPLIIIYRGLYIARNSLDPFFFQTNFRLGLAAVGLLGLYYSDSPISWMIITFVLYLIIGLIGSTISRIHSLNDQRGGRIPPPGWSRSAELISAVLIIVCTGIFLGWLIGFQLGNESQRIIISIFSIIFLLIGILLSPILFVVLLIFEQLAKLLPKDIVLPSALESSSELVNDYLKNMDTTIPGFSNIIDIGVVIFLGIVLLLIVGLILVGLKWKNQSSKIQMELDSSLIENKLNRHVKRHKRGWMDHLMNARNLRKYYYANRIRAIYSRFLSLCASIGTPRDPAKTPNEFLSEIIPIFPGNGNEVSLITSSYIRIRYGEFPETEEEFESVKDAWQVIKAYGNRMKSKKGKRSK